MKVNFYLPNIYRGIAGGYKVVYQYSNYLADMGHDMHIYYNMKNGENAKRIPRFVCRVLRRIIFIGYPKWFKLHKNVSQSAVKNFDEKYIRNADISIATSPYTAYPIAKLSKSKGERFYFIQGYENWGDTPDEFVHKSYSLGMKNIVISNWLKGIVDKYSQGKSKLIANGIDLNIFKVNESIEERNPNSICMLYSEGEIKGSKYGIEALKRLKKKYPNLEVNFFSSFRRPSNLPEWIKYTKNATETEVVSLLNKSAIYVCTSLEEGFGLPGLEAMACGCALVTTNCFGIMEYANQDNAMISKPKDVDMMYKNIERLLEDNEFRISLAKKGNVSIQNRALDISEKKFADFLLNNEKK